VEDAVCMHHINMKKGILYVLLMCSVFSVMAFYVIAHGKPREHSSEKHKDNFHYAVDDATIQNIKALKADIIAFNSKNGLSEQVCFIADMRIPSGKERFFVYDLKQDSILKKGLVAHGSCNKLYLDDAQFSNTPDCGCSSFGKYKIGYQYKGRFGDAFKLHGLDSSNSNAYKRFIVLHAHECVPDSASHPQPICNSLGCPTVSVNMLTYLKQQVKVNKKPVMLWVIGN